MTQPKGYIIAEIEVHDAVVFEDYRTQVAPMIAGAGGRYLARGGTVVEFEGKAPTGRSVVIEFPSLAAAETFLRSEEYRPVADIRRRSSNSRVYMVEGAPL